MKLLSRSLLGVRGWWGLVVVLALHTTCAFEWSSNPRGVPEVDRHALAGIWRLTPRTSPMKEFTVYPKRPTEKEPDVLLMLKEDGSFQQYESSENDTDQDIDLDKSWSKFQKQQQQRQKEHQQAVLRKHVLKGTWDFVDGKLILAADRPDDESSNPSTKTHQSRDTSSYRKSSTRRPSTTEDTLLVGRVVATYGKSLTDNPVLETTTTTNATTSLSQAASSQSSNSHEQLSSSTTSKENAVVNKADSTSDTDLDAHLSVPKGSVKVGRFFYPKNHPSFFEQPMFQPVRRGAFTLQQVLGTLNAKVREQEEFVEKYRRSDFYNKTFLLTSHPIGYRQPKGKKRWSIKYNKFVEDPPSEAAAKAAEEEQNRAVPIRVMQVQFHANNTFSTVAGLGEAILRGKFDIIGHSRDQLWMQVWRFGFGRSVSGSVYSEGKCLTHEDAKTYWGTIGPETDVNDAKSGSEHESNESTGATFNVDDNVDIESDSEAKSERLEVKGSVLFGWGLEPMPVARFIMRETNATESILEDEEDDEEEEDDDEEDEALKLESLSQDGVADDGIDWTGDDEAAFQ